MARMTLNMPEQHRPSGRTHAFKQALKLALLSASAVVGVLVAVFIAERMPAPAIGEVAPPAGRAVQAEVVLGDVQLQQPAAHLARSAPCDAAEAPLPPPCAVSPTTLGMEAPIEARVAALAESQPGFPGNGPRTMDRRQPTILRCEGCTLVVDRQFHDDLEHSSNQVLVVLAPRVVYQRDGVRDSGERRSE